MTLKRWLPTFLAFPIGGYIASETIGSVHDVPSALAAGLLAGAVIGAAQAKALGPTEGGSRWAGITAIAMATGMAIATSATNAGTEMADVMLAGAITGAAIGVAQATHLGRGPLAGLTWAIATSIAWTLGWAVTANVIVDIERGFVVFGSSGALAATAITGLVLRRILREPRRGAGHPSASSATDTATADTVARNATAGPTNADTPTLTRATTIRDHGERAAVAGA